MKSEYLEVVQSLRRHHALFAQFWTVGNIVETRHPKMPTAAIAFDKKTGAGVQFLINPDFWATLNSHDKAFVIAHEIMHVYLDHGRRSLGLDGTKANIAQDVVINHYLVDFFDFDRSKLSFADRYCWIDTVFPDRKDIEPNRCFEYYYDKLPEDNTGGGGDESGEGVGYGNGSDPVTVDVHDFMGDVDEDLLDEIQKAAEDLMDRITPEEVEKFEEIISTNKEESKKAQQQKAGTMAGVLKKRISLGRVQKKPKWETVIAKEVGRLGGRYKDMDIELWTRPNRRLAGMGGDLILPATVNETISVRDRVDVWFFQDTSGSCVDYAERFFKAAASIPEDRFKIRMFCFDTKVYETSLSSGKLYGFGGTSFQPIENYIQKLVKEEECKYPQAVFIITDGYGSSVNPEFANKWHWFLTQGGATHHIPADSHTYKLEDYE
jgi:predicted metal-dependent peptidase